MLQKVTKNSLVDTIKSNTTKQGTKSASKAQSFPISTAGTANFEAQSSVKTSVRLFEVLQKKNVYNCNKLEAKTQHYALLNKIKQLLKNRIL